jgi:hypothetical protein
MMYEADNDSLATVGSKVKGSLLVIVRTPLAEVAEEEVVVDCDLPTQLVKMTLQVNINANEKYANFFKLTSLLELG